MIVTCIGGVTHWHPTRYFSFYYSPSNLAVKIALVGSELKLIVRRLFPFCCWCNALSLVMAFDPSLVGWRNDLLVSSKNPWNILEKLTKSRNSHCFGGWGVCFSLCSCNLECVFIHRYTPYPNLYPDQSPSEEWTMEERFRPLTFHGLILRSQLVTLLVRGVCYSESQSVSLPNLEL